MSLSNDDKNNIKDLFESIRMYPSCFQSYYDLVKANLENNDEWLSNNNPFLKLGPPDHKKIWDNIKNQGSFDLIGETMVSSAPIHVIESSSYYSRALSALVEGDISTSIHMGYYAELRASKAILAVNGILNFNHTNLKYNIVDNNFECFNTDGTHTFIWNVIEEWLRVGEPSKTLINNLYVLDLSIDQWLKTLTGAETSLISIDQLMQQFTFDLQFFKTDQKARNWVSYDPAFTSTKTKPLDVVDFCYTLMHLFSPVKGKQIHQKCFELFDFQILKHLFLQGITTKIKKKKNIDQERREFFLERIETVTNSSPQYEKLKEMYDVSFGEKILQFAINKNKPENSDYVFGVLSRAFFLIRFAISLTNNSMLQNNFNKNDYIDWLSGFAVHRGLIDCDSQLEESYDNFYVLQEDYNNYVYDKLPDSIYNLNQLNSGETIRNYLKLEYLGVLGLV